jgi:hypothetical protein
MFAAQRSAEHGESSATRSAPPRAAAPAAALTAAGALALQRRAGNRAVRALLSRCPSCGGTCGCEEHKEEEAELDAGKDDAGTGTAPAPGGAGATATPAPKKTVTIYPITLGSSTRDPYADIKRADEIWAKCGVAVKGLIGQCSTSNVLDTEDPKDALNEFSDPKSPTKEELAMLGLRPGPPSALHAYYVPRMTAGSRGEAFTPTDNKISAVVISDSAASDSLAHEIGHVLLDSGVHTDDPDELMASGGIRNVGVDKITPAQCTKATS